MRATALFFDWWDALHLATTGTRIGSLVKKRWWHRKKLPKPAAVAQQREMEGRIEELESMCQYLVKCNEELNRSHDELADWIEVVQGGGAIDRYEPSWT